VVACGAKKKKKGSMQTVHSSEDGVRQVGAERARELMHRHDSVVTCGLNFFGVCEL